MVASSSNQYSSHAQARNNLVATGQYWCNDNAGRHSTSTLIPLHKTALCLQHRETADDDEMQGKSSNMVSKSTQSLADITNSTYDKPTRMTKKVISGRLPDYVLPKRTAVDKTAEANSCLTLVLDWTLSTLYYSSGDAISCCAGTDR